MADPNTLPIPSTRALLTSLITTLATSTQHSQGTSNPLSDASENTKSALLTLHTLFPTDLLPALDLLDRGLVTRLVLASASASDTATSNNNTEEQVLNPLSAEEEYQAQNQTVTQNQIQNQNPPTRTRKQTLSYHVRTAQQQKSSSRSSRSSNSHTGIQAPTTTYQVSLPAWTCSCPAFAFAAFPADQSSELGITTSTRGGGSRATDDENWIPSRETEMGWRFGGLTLGDGVPACKHLLACVIAERCGGFGGMVEEREVEGEEFGGWAAGWGD